MSIAIVNFIRELYQSNDFIPLHAPTFVGNELKYVTETIESTFVSSVGKFVDTFETQVESFTGAVRAIATVNGTAALHTALYMAGVQSGDYVITQALTFVATCNALHHMGAEPIFVDVEKVSLSLCPKALENYLSEYAYVNEKGCFHKGNNRKITAVVPMHTFGHPADLDELVSICKSWQLTLVEDAAESLGSFYKGRHTGTIGEFGALSFNGNKIITTGGGGMVLCSNTESGVRTKHITTTAKQPHAFEFYHDEPGFNYRLPNINAALGCAQLEALPKFLHQKRKIAERYQEFFAGSSFYFVKEPTYARSNYWLNAIICPDKQSRDEVLQITNNSGVMTRPVWKLMHHLPMYKDSLRDSLEISEQLESCIINLPSSAI